MNTPTILRSQIRDVGFGKNVKIVEPSNLYECKIGDDCFVGPFVEIQKGVIIGNRCKIQSHAFICELVTIGHDCFISHGAMFINDLFSIGGPAHGNKNLWKETHVGNNVSIGTNATILPVKSRGQMGMTHEYGKRLRLNRAGHCDIICVDAP